MAQETCPACEQEASATAEIGMGDNWSDVVGRPPHSLFSDYVMVHVGGTNSRGEIVVFFHTERDLQDNF